MSTLNSPEEKLTQLELKDSAALLFSIFIVAACALTYELVISTVASYFLGSSVLHFSLTIGLFMFFLGVGAFFSKFIASDELKVFVLTESLLGIVGGFSVILLQAAFAYTPYFYLVAFLVTAAIGILCGLEIPLLTRILSRFQGIKETIAHALSFDYVGGLIASIVFPLVLLPVFGTTKTALLIGLVNLSVSATILWQFRKKLNGLKLLILINSFGVVCLLIAVILAEKWSSIYEATLYDDEIVYSDQSSYQRIILTKFKDDFRLYLNGDLQFSSVDEYRYHEVLVHAPMSIAKSNENILILGGGDGLALREVLLFPGVKRVTLVDLDPKMTDLAKNNRLLKAANRNSLEDSRVSVINQDAWNFLNINKDKYDVVIIDLPDPNDYSLGKLYSLEFYLILKKSLHADSVVITQAGSPYFARQAFWCLYHTISKVFPGTLPIHNFVPSFGPWGYIIATFQPEVSLRSSPLQSSTRYYKDHIIPSLTQFDTDTSEVETDINRLDNQILVSLAAKGWNQWQ